MLVKWNIEGVHSLDQTNLETTNTTHHIDTNDTVINLIGIFITLFELELLKKAIFLLFRKLLTMN